MDALNVYRIKLDGKIDNSCDQAIQGWEQKLNCQQYDTIDIIPHLNSFITISSASVYQLNNLSFLNCIIILLESERNETTEIECFLVSIPSRKICIFRNPTKQKSNLLFYWVKGDFFENVLLSLLVRCTAWFDPVCKWTRFEFRFFSFWDILLSSGQIGRTPRVTQIGSFPRCCFVFHLSPVRVVQKQNDSVMGFHFLFRIRKKNGAASFPHSICLDIVV